MIPAINGNRNLIKGAFFQIKTRTGISKAMTSLYAWNDVLRCYFIINTATIREKNFSACIFNY